MAATIQSVKARQIFDSRGNPTVEVRASLPSPAFAGSISIQAWSRHAVPRPRLIDLAWRGSIVGLPACM
jgi:enolase